MPRSSDPRTVSVDPLTDHRWSSFVASRASSLFHSPPWVRVLAETYDFPLQARMVIDDQEGPLAGLLYAEIDDFLDPRRASLPFSDYCGPIGAETTTWRALVDDMIGPKWRIDVRCLDGTPALADERFSVVGRSCWHGIDLNRRLEDIFQSFDSSARRAIRRSESSGLTVRMAASERDLRAFFDLHLGVRKYKYRLLAQPFGFFERIWREFIERDDGVLALALLDGEVVGATMYLIWQDTLYYKFNASLAGSLGARPNDRLIWEGVKTASERGLRFFDFGISDTDQPGLIKYKRKYATSEQTVTYLRYSPPGVPSRPDEEARALLRGITELLVQDSVSDEVSERAGDLLYRYFT